MDIADPIRCVHQPSTDRICTLCGAYAFKGLHQYGLKTSRFFGTFFDLSVLRSSQNTFITQNAITPLSKQTIQRIQKVQQKLNLSLHTVVLGVYLYFSVFNNKQQETKNIGICLCLSAKLLQHIDKKIVHKFRKYFKKIFQKQQYHEKQAQILIKTDFNLNIITFVDFIFHYLSKGGCFSSQMVDVVKFQQSILKTSKKMLFDGSFMMFRPEEMAIAILYNCRLQHKLIQVWNWHIEQCTKVLAKQALRKCSIVKSLVGDRINQRIQL